jgi:hypothetical protein
VPLDSRKAAHILANRAKIQAGRSETVVFVAVNGGAISYTAVAGCVLNEVNAVPAGVSNRTGAVSRTSYDAWLEVPSAAVLPAGTVREIARTGTASLAGVTAAADRYVVLDRRRAGLAVTGSGGGTNAGDRWVYRLRRIR